MEDKIKSLVTFLWRMILLYHIVFFYYSAIMFLVDGDNDRWFQRIALSLILAGLYYAGRDKKQC